MNRITEAIEEIFWFPLTYLGFAMLTTIPMIVLINEVNGGIYIKGLLFLFPIGWIFSLMIIYSIKMKYGYVFIEEK